MYGHRICTAITILKNVEGDREGNDKMTLIDLNPDAAGNNSSSILIFMHQPDLQDGSARLGPEGGRDDVPVRRGGGVALEIIN